jgi:serine/threonine protein kinase
VPTTPSHGDGIRARTDLQEFIQKHQGHISERFIRGVFTRMLNGLREVHSNKLLHLDLKPSNIYLRADNTPVLIDLAPRARR